MKPGFVLAMNFPSVKVYKRLETITELGPQKERFYWAKDSDMVGPFNSLTEAMNDFRSTHKLMKKPLQKLG